MISPKTLQGYTSIDPRDRSQYQYRRDAALAYYHTRKENVRKSRICHLIIIGLILLGIGFGMYIHFVVNGYFDKTLFRRVIVDGVEVEVFSEDFLFQDESEKKKKGSDALSQPSGEDKDITPLLSEKWGSVLNVDKVQCNLNNMIGPSDNIDDVPGLTLEERTSLKLQRAYCKELHEVDNQDSKQEKAYISSLEDLTEKTSGDKSGFFLPLLATVRTLIPFLFMIIGLRCFLVAYRYLYYPRESFYSQDCNKFQRDKAFNEALKETHDFSLHRDRDETLSPSKDDIAEFWKGKDLSSIFTRSFDVVFGNSNTNLSNKSASINSTAANAHISGSQLLMDHMKLNRTSASVSAGASRIPNFYCQEAANRMLFADRDADNDEKVADKGNTSATPGRFLRQTNEDMKQSRGYMRSRGWLLGNTAPGERGILNDQGYPHLQQANRGQGVDVEFCDNSKGAFGDNGMLRGSTGVSGDGGGTEEELLLARLQSLMGGRGGNNEGVSIASVESIVTLYTSLRKLAMWRTLGVQHPNVSIANARRWVFAIFQELDKDIKRCNTNLTRYGMGLYDCSLCLSMPDPSAGAPQMGTAGAASTPGFGTSPAPTSISRGFGTGGFGTQPTGGFGTQPTGGFGTQPTGGFGTQPTGGFGTQPTGGFGTQPTGGFGISKIGTTVSNVTSAIPPPTGRSSMSCLMTEKEKLLLQPPDMVSMDKIEAINHRIILEGVLEVAGAAVYKAAAALSESSGAVPPGQSAPPSQYLHPKERQYRRAYVINRINTFSRLQSGLPSYRNNGIDCEGWDESLPQDPHFVAHIISTRVALFSRAFNFPHMPGLSTSISAAPSCGSTAKDSARIIMGSTGEPYFYVAVGKEGSPMSSGGSVCINSGAATGRYTSNFGSAGEIPFGSSFSDIPSFVVSAGHNTYYRTSENGDSLFESLVIFAALQSKLGNTFKSSDDIHSTDLLNVAI